MNLYETSNNLLEINYEVSSWFVGGILIFIFLSSIIIGISIFWKNKSVGLITGFILGVIGIGIFTTIRHSSIIDDSQIVSAKNWLELSSKIFFDLIMVIVPLYVFSMIILLFIEKKNQTINKKTYATSFASLLGLSLFGISIAIAMIPLILLIPDKLTNFSPGESAPIDWVDIVKRYIVILFIFMGVFIGVLLKVVGKRNSKIHTNSLTFFLNLKKVSLNLLLKIIFMVPFVIAFSLTTIGLANTKEMGNMWLIILIYLGIYWLGAIIIFLILFLSNIFFSSSTQSPKEKSLLLIKHAGYVFGTQSISASLSKTQELTRTLGVSDDISNLTPTKGIVMGMVMCNGFTPTLIILMSLNNYGNLSFLFVLATILLVFILVISSSGSGSADYTITITSLSILNINNLFYLNLIIPVQEINEAFVSKTNNVYGHIFASLLTEKVNSKIDEK